MSKIKTVIQFLRITHWIKNLIIILPIFFSGQLFSISNNKIIIVFLAFLLLCCFSSIVYIINDFVDVEKDRLHPLKKKRPLAAKTLTKNEATGLLVTLSFLSFILSSFLEPKIIGVAGAYLFLNILYSFVLKNYAIIDIVCISIGFILRLFVGALAVSIPLTPWIVVLVFLLMFSIALEKRRDDLVLSLASQETYRKSQNGYTIEFIDVAKSISFSVTLVAYIIYSVSDDVIERVGSDYVYVTAFPVFIGIMRYIQLSVIQKRTGSPVNVLFKDLFLLITIIIWIILFAIILYS